MTAASFSVLEQLRRPDRHSPASSGETDCNQHGDGCDRTLDLPRLERLRGHVWELSIEWRGEPAGTQTVPAANFLVDSFLGALR